MIENTKKFFESRPKIKKIIGIIFLIIGILALVTPLTPGSWLVFVGLELLGVNILFFDKFKFWNKKDTKV
jgi:hypothetical protein